VSCTGGTLKVAMVVVDHGDFFYIMEMAVESLENYNKAILLLLSQRKQKVTSQGQKD
jgi:hypothetical protein